MNASLRLHAWAGLALSLSAFNSFAAESTVYHFQDGTVTVTPRDSQTTPPSPRANASSEKTSSTTPSLSDESRLLVRPVSHLQIGPVPMPDGTVVPQIQQFPEQGTVVPQLQSTPVAPVPMAGELPGCCDNVPPAINPRSTDVMPKSTVTLSTVAMYRDVYNSIPFSRVEFNHYPNYRHDATMEFLFNQMRTTIINRNTGSAYDYYGSNYGGYLGYPYYDPPAYPFSYGLRIHRSR